jgi:hypothetical protein
MNDAYEILGVSRDASLREVSAAWRRLAKEWHPDLRGDANALGRMVQLNAAYEQILAERTGRVAAPATASAPTAPDEGAGDEGRPRGRGWWLDPHLRLALGAELLQSLNDQEQVDHIVPCEVGGSSALLVITDRRLLWLLDDNVLGRVRSIPLAGITDVDRPPQRPWRRSAAVRVHRGRGRTTFGGLAPDVADRVFGAIREARPVRAAAR